ncbi:MAG: hypothetical protein EAZ51_02525 [Sphingobacteriales bacterium]|nr:MAG: hypothetical protein EAZ64_03460 [Sphingobacteriales bacterium]TAF82427.1 MAG: hypothetical protein EAZ51_02525 [Sphingobacteriales bacterium]
MAFIVFLGLNLLKFRILLGIINLFFGFKICMQTICTKIQGIVALRIVAVSPQKSEVQRSFLRTISGKPARTPKIYL